MLRNLVLAGLTALLLASLASGARAGARSTAGRKKSESVHQPQTTTPEADVERPARPIAPARKKVVVRVESRAQARRRLVRRVHAAVVNTSLLRQSWTVADLNPMPALLDLDDTTKNLRRATAEIVRLMTR